MSERNSQVVGIMCLGISAMATILDLGIRLGFLIVRGITLAGGHRPANGSALSSWSTWYGENHAWLDTAVAGDSWAAGDYDQLKADFDDSDADFHAAVDSGLTQVPAPGGN